MTRQNEETLRQLRHIGAFVAQDLEKCDGAGANFLVCVGCLNGTELLGGVDNGQVGLTNEVGSRLRAGIKRMGALWVEHEEEVVELRHSMIHAYLGATKRYSQVEITNHEGWQLPVSPLALSIVNGAFIVNVTEWRKRLERAWGEVLDELASDTPRLEALGVAMSRRLPFLK